MSKKNNRIWINSCGWSTRFAVFQLLWYLFVAGDFPHVLDKQK